MVRQANTRGLDPVEAIRLASYNTAQYFRLYNRGAIAPGFVADLVVLDDLRTFGVESVYKDGLLVAQEGKLQDDASSERDKHTVSSEHRSVNSIHIGTVTEQDLRMAGRPGLVEVIGIEPGQIITRHLREEAPLHNG